MTSSKKHPLAWIIPPLIAAWAGDIISRPVRQTWQASHDPARSLNASLDAWKNPRPSLNRIDLTAALAAAIIILLTLLYQWAGAQTRRDGEEHGSAAWAEPKDMTPYTDKDPGKTLLMTATQRLSLDTHKTRRNLNVLVTGASGSGKTRGYVLPNMRNLADHHTPISLAITDPKGEIHAHTASMMRHAGWQVKTFNLIDMASSDHFNPLDYMNPDDPEGDIMRLADNILTNTAGKNKTSGDFWDKAARSLLTSLLAYTYFSAEPADRNLNTVTSMLSRMRASENDPDQASPIDDLMNETNEWIDDAHQAGEDYDQEARRALDGLAFACSQYRTYSQGPAETRASIITTLANQTAGLLTSRIKTILNDDSMSLDTVGDKPTVIYIIISDTNQTFTYLAAIFYQCLFTSATYRADHNPTGSLAIPLHCMLDEFANIGKIPGFPTLISTMRSRNISVSVILQTISQIKALYKDDWETIAANCDSKLFLGGNDLTTTKWYSEILGSQTITTRSTTENRGTNGSYSIQQSKQKRELLTPDELGRLDNTTSIYILRGLKPFHSKKLD